MPPAAHGRSGIVQERQRVHVVFLPARFLARAADADLFCRAVVHGGDIGVVFLAFHAAAHRFIQLTERVRQSTRPPGGVPAHAAFSFAEGGALHH